MKTKIRAVSPISYFAVLLACLFLINITSCKKPSPTTATGAFYFHLHSNLQGNEIDSPSFLLDSLNLYTFSVTIPQYFISGITLRNANGSTYTFPNVYILKSLDSEQYYIGTAPVGTYTSVTFNIGLDAATNSKIPSAFLPTASYVPTSSMWFGNTTQGYMFMKLQGLCDTTAGHTGKNLIPFSYEIGSASNLRTVTMPIRGSGSYSTYAPYTLLAGGTQYIHLICDYGQILCMSNYLKYNIDSTDTYNIMPAVANEIANTFPTMFHYEE